MLEGHCSHAVLAAELLSRRLIAENLSQFMKEDFIVRSRRHTGWLVFAWIVLNLPGTSFADTPVLTPPASLNGNQVQFTLSGASNYNYAIQTSTDLLNWTSVTTNGNAGSNGAWIIIAPATNDVLFFRAAKVTIPAFRFALAAQATINFAGSNMLSDSFDSTDPLYSTAGQYDASKRKAGGDLATDSSLAGAVSLGNAEIYGALHTGTESQPATVQIGTNGTVGGLAWDPGNSGIEPGFWNYDMNLNFPEVPQPMGSWLPPVSGVYKGTVYRYFLATGNYALSSLTLSGQSKMIVTGSAILWVPVNITMSGQSSITIASGGSLIMYVGRPDAGGTNVAAVFGGNGVVNTDGFAKDFQLYCLPNVTNVVLYTSFAGTIYAPQADIGVYGPLDVPLDFFGSIVGKTITAGESVRFHYDESLRTAGPSF